jgi:hypothetical protein
MQKARIAVLVVADLIAAILTAASSVLHEAQGNLIDSTSNQASRSSVPGKCKHEGRGVRGIAGAYVPHSSVGRRGVAWAREAPPGAVPDAFPAQRPDGPSLLIALAMTNHQYCRRPLSPRAAIPQYKKSSPVCRVPFCAMPLESLWSSMETQCYPVATEAPLFVGPCRVDVEQGVLPGHEPGPSRLLSVIPFAEPRVIRRVSFVSRSMGFPLPLLEPRFPARLLDLSWRGVLFVA